MRVTSTKEGTLRRRQSSEHRRAAVIKTKAEFFAPLILTCPCKEEPPQTCNTAGSASGDGRVGIKA